MPYCAPPAKLAPIGARQRRASYLFIAKNQKHLLGAELFYSEQKESEVGGGGDEEDGIGELVA